MVGKDRPTSTYEIKVQGHLDPSWSDWFEGMTIATGCGEDGTPITTFTGHLADQAALHGVLGRIRDINMPLLSVNVDSKQQEQNSRKEET